MKKEDLTTQGLTEEQIGFIMAENGKDIAKEQIKIVSAIKERDEFKGQLDSVQEKLKAFDGVDVKSYQEQIKTLTDNISSEKIAYEIKISEMQFDTLLADKLANEKFSSSYAKNGIIADIKAKGLKIENGNILGFDDVIKGIKEIQPTAWTIEDVNPNRLGFGSPPPGNLDIPQTGLSRKLNENRIIK